MSSTEPAAIANLNAVGVSLSLTVNDLSEDRRCQVAIIPFTWSHTNISSLQPRSHVNVEGDLIGKYVRRLAQPWSGQSLPNEPIPDSNEAGSAHAS